MTLLFHVLRLPLIVNMADVIGVQDVMLNTLECSICFDQYDSLIFFCPLKHLNK